MTASPVENTHSNVVGFRDARWSPRWIVVALAVLLLWHAVPLVSRAWFSRFPLWLVVAFTGLIPQIFLLIFPVITRQPNRRQTFGVPPPARCLVEFGISILVVLGTCLVLVVINYIVGRVAPGASLVPDTLAHMASSPNRILICLQLLFAFTFAPVAEELFFRGFLHNAFRARMPLVVAALAQSLIFGFGHFFGLKHAVIAFVLGLLQTAVYEWRRTLITPILVHAGINFLFALGTVLAMFAQANSPVMGVGGDPQDKVCVVHRVAPASPAAAAQIQVGDIITSFNNEPIRNFPHLLETVLRYHPGDAVPVALTRSGKVLQVTVVLQSRGALEKKSEL